MSNTRPLDNAINRESALSNTLQTTTLLRYGLFASPSETEAQYFKKFLEQEIECGHIFLQDASDRLKAYKKKLHAFPEESITNAILSSGPS